MAMPSVQEMEAYIRAQAAKLGIDPDIAVRVAKSEGLQPGTWQAKSNLDYGREQSFGPFQLHVDPTGKKPGLGNAFMAKTGLNPADPSTWMKGVDFALNKAKNTGWGDWFGAKKEGITGMMGIGKPMTYEELMKLQRANPTLAGIPSVAQRMQPSASSGIMPTIMNSLGLSARVTPNTTGGGILGSLGSMLSGTGEQPAAPTPAPAPTTMNPGYVPAANTEMNYGSYGIGATQENSEEEKIKRLLASLGM